ncbi:MAG: hypothetical protein U0L99_02700 [Ruminococcus sp.]|nr:hypothetical protein [Ruminococcus sp.]
MSALYSLLMIRSDRMGLSDFDRSCITPEKVSAKLKYLDEYQGVVKLAFMLFMLLLGE